eukprot:1137059-Prymnesium_polylepis.1
MVTDWNPRRIVKSAHGQRTKVTKIGRVPLKQLGGYRVKCNETERIVEEAVGSAEAQRDDGR